MFVAACDQNMIVYHLAGFLNNIGKAPFFADFYIFEDLDSLRIASFSWHLHLPEVGMEDKPDRNFAQIRERYGRGGRS